MNRIIEKLIIKIKFKTVILLAKIGFISTSKAKKMVTEISINHAKTKEGLDKIEKFMKED
ncbi:MAG: hypothetical protein HUJ87_14830 [Fusobacterium varium]|uniref:hypothetical protein n=1 Tax=Fusobacterium varium TaxID=856 RepID=UPI00242A9955|nr:hypothetical protein [Fusobacterium varium]MCF0171766.1 hypothetical protein [Fusobacterium varium]